METTSLGFGAILGSYWGHIGIMEKKMGTTIVYWGYIPYNIREFGPTAW